MPAKQHSGRLTRARRVASRAVRRWRRLRPGERSLPLQALVALPAVALALRLRGLARVQTALQRWPRAPGAPVARGAADAARRVAWCVYVAATHGLWPANCLQRSVVTVWFLRRRRILGELRIGVRRGADGQLDFHAWVEHDGQVINDHSDVRDRYATFDRVIAPSGPSRWGA